MKKIGLLAILLFISNLSAQGTWIDMNASFGSEITSINSLSSSLLYVSVKGKGPFGSTDGGQHWTLLNKGLKGGTFGKLFISPDGYFYTSTDSLGGCVSADSGKSWQAILSLPVGILPFISGPDNALYSIQNQGTLSWLQTCACYVGPRAIIRQSTDHGTNWATIYSEAGQSLGVKTISSLSLDPDGNIFAGTNAGLLKLKPGEAQWRIVTPSLATVFNTAYVTLSGNWLFAETSTDSLLYSSDSGETWVPAPGLPAYPVTALSVNEKNGIWTGLNGAGIYYATSPGGGWSPLPTQPNDVAVTALYPTTESIYSGTANGRLFQYRFKGEGTTEKGNVAKDRTASLSHNYPNPFNPGTTIHFSLPGRMQVNLDVFNIIGQHVATLASGIMSAGDHEVKWNAASQPSGVYLYHLRAGDMNEVRKMILAK